MLSFPTAISRAVRRTFQYGGRAPRSEYWWFQLFALVLMVAAFLLDEALGLPIVWDGSALLSAIVILGTAPTQITLTMRRFQDRGLNGLWSLPYSLVGVVPTGQFERLIEVIGLTAFIVLGVAFIIYLVWAFVQTVLPSQPRGNAYGPGPDSGLVDVFS